MHNLIQKKNGTQKLYRGSKRVPHVFFLGRKECLNFYILSLFRSVFQNSMKIFGIPKLTFFNPGNPETLKTVCMLLYIQNFGIL